MRGYFSWALIAALWLFVVAGAVHAGDTWQWSSSANTSLNFSYSGFDDPFLDYTTPLVFTVKFQDAQGNAIDNTTGSCWLNFSFPTEQTIFLNYSAGEYRTSLTYGSVSSGNTFTLHCQDGAVVHTFSNVNGTVVFQYDVYEPVLVDVYTSSEAGQEALPLISGQYTTFYILAQNITGSTEPISITDVDCNLSVDGAASVSATQVSGDYLVAEHLLASTGDVRLEGMCEVGGGTYISEPRNVSVQPLFVPSGMDLGEVDVYQQPILLLANGSDSFFAHLAYEGGLYARMQVSRLYPSFATVMDLDNEALLGQFAFADFFNAGGLTLLYAGQAASSVNLFSFLNNGFSTLDYLNAIDGIETPSISVFDQNVDGTTDAIVSGKNDGVRTTVRLQSNGSGFTSVSTGLPALEDASLCYGDFDGNSRYDLFVSGKNASGIVSGVYLYNGSDYELSKSLPVQLYKGSCALGRFLNENTTSLIHFGTSSATSPDTPSNWDYVIYNDTREWSMAPSGLLPGFNGTIRGDAVVADFSGDGLSDIALCGGTSGHAVLSLYINDLEQSGGFVAVDPFNDSYALPECSLSAADYDFDGDLDLAYTGVGSDAPVLLFNNTASEISPNTNPLPPAELSGAWNLTTGALWINWSAGSDVETPTGMLSYNLEVESVHGELLLSGQTTVGSHPVQGYLGNMQYRRNTTLYNQTPGNVHVRVQSVDSGLAQSAWTEITVSLDACSPTQEWNVSVAGGCVMPASVQPNSHIIIRNGSSLTLSSATVLGENTTIEVENGTLDVTGYSLSSINATIRLGAFGDISSSRVNLSGVTLDFGRNYTLSDSSLDAIVVGKNVILINTSWNSLDVDGELDVRYYLELNASNQFGKALDAVEVHTAEGFLTSGSRLNLTAWLINATGNWSVSHNLSFFLSGYYAANASYVLTGNSRANLTLYLKPEPDTGELSLSTVSGVTGDNYSSDLLAYSQAENVTLEKVGVGAIRFLESVNLSFLNLSKVVAIGPNVIRVNASEAPGLNRSAQLRFFNLTFSTEPVLLRNGVPCEQCDNISYASGVLNATVPGFSEYSLVNNSELSLLTPSVLFNGTTSTFAVSYHAYGNDSDNIEGANCSVTVENSTLSMLAGQSNHSVNLLLNGTGNISAQVYCSGNSTYEPLNVSFALTVVRSGAYFLKDSAYTGLVYSFALFGNLSDENRFWASGAVDLSETVFDEVSVPVGFSLGQTLEDGDAILADLNHDGWGDLVVMGSGTLAWYDNRTTRKPLNLSLFDGDFALLDMDADGDEDIIACGLNASNEPQTLVLENQLADENYQRGVSFSRLPHHLPDLSQCQLLRQQSGDMVQVLIAGLNRSGGSQIEWFRYNGNEFDRIQSFGVWHLPALAMLMHDLTEDGQVDLVLAGEYNSSSTTSFYVGNGTGFAYDAELSSQLVDFGRLGTQMAVGRMTNASNQSLLISGLSTNGLQVVAYGYNGSGFEAQDIALDVEPTYYGSLTLGDVDADSDLDLLVTGQGSGGATTQLYSSTLADYAGADTPPLAPAIIEANYSNGYLFLNWSEGTDAESPDMLLAYGLRVGTVLNPNLFVSGAETQPDELGNAHSANLSLPDACMVAQVKTIDASDQASDWSLQAWANNHSEICNGYDNDCDGLTDEDFLYPGTDLYIYNGSLNGTAFTCEFYETYDQQQLSCPNNPTVSPGTACRTDTYMGAVYAWNSVTKTCDCDLSDATLKNVQVDSHRSSGSSASYAPAVTETESEPEAPAEDSQSPDVAVSTSESSGGSSAARDSFTVDADGFEVRTEVTAERGWTYVSHQIRNTERTDKEAIIFHIEYDAPVADSLELLRSLSPYEVDTEGYARFSIGSLGYLEEETLLYSIPGTYSLADIQESRIAIKAESLHDAESLAALEEQQTQTAREAVRTNISETVVDNKTVIRMDIDLQNNVTEVYGVEIEQEIPKCLINEITESVLEAAIDPALLEHVSIKEADPLLVWRFDRLEDAVNLELTLDALRSADCDDEVTLELLAKSYIYQNQPINWFSVMWVLVLSGSVILLVISPIFLASRHRFHRHESPHVLRLAKTIVRDSHRGVSNAHIKSNLLANDESKVDIEAAFSHVAETNISHLGLTWFEHRVEIALFFSVLALSLMELSGLLPGYLDWFKKVLSWVLMLLVVHHANLSRLFFNEDAPRFSLCLMLGMFFMHLVHLAEFASEGLSKSVGFVFDWYVLVVRLDASIHLSWILFSIGLLVLAACGVYAAWRLPVRERSLGSLFFREPLAYGWMKAVRTVGLLAIFCVFFLSVFNRLIEWLAIAVDSALFVVAAVILLALTLSMLAHHHGNHTQRYWDALGEALADSYLLWLALPLGLMAVLRPFLPEGIVAWGLGAVTAVILLTLGFVVLRLRKLHELDELERIPVVLDHLYEKFIRLMRYPRTLPLALAGLPILQLIVEIVLTVVPNITGQGSHLYGSGVDQTLFSLMGDTGLISQQLFMMSGWDALLHACGYLASFIGLVALLLTPVWLWTLAYANRGAGIASGSLLSGKAAHASRALRTGRWLLAIAPAWGMFYWLHPILRIEPLLDSGSAGVQFLPQLIQMGSTACWDLEIAFSVMLLFIVLLNVERVRDWAMYMASGISVALLTRLYFLPFVQSLAGEVIALMYSGVGQGWIFIALGILLGVLQGIDIVLVYLIGGACFVFLLLPQDLKQRLSAWLAKLPVFRHVFELADRRHLLEYYDEARSRFAGNLVHHVRHYMRRCSAEGVPPSEQLRILLEHGYPERVVELASATHSASRSSKCS